ncbi:MAG: hypothetical protein AAF408_13085 [Pseudomonadota bacterium]
MNNVIEFTAPTASKTRSRAENIKRDVISLDDWRTQPHPIRTSHGVFFVSYTWDTTGDAA